MITKCVFVKAIALWLGMQLCVAQQQPIGFSEPLADFFRAMLEGYDRSAIQRQFPLVHERIRRTQPQEIVAALPFILTALGHSDEYLRERAAVSLVAVSFRLDSAKLLSSYTGDVAVLLESADPAFQRSGVTILGSLQPSVPPDGIVLLVSFLRRDDRDLLVQAAAVSYLLRHGPADQRVLTTVNDFLDRPMDVKVKVNALNAVGDPRITDAHLISRVIGALDDREEQIRFTAAGVLGRIGRVAVLQGEQALRRIAEDRKEPEYLRRAAKESLTRLTRDP